MTDLIIGIDLGTTNSEVAVVQDGQPRVLPVDGHMILPSVVGLAEDGRLLVGHPARNQYTLYPERTIRSVKRRMGEDIHLPLGEQAYTPQEVSAMILKRLKQAAEAALGQPVGKAVITVPAYFSDAQRQATRDAGELAGLEVVRIINEPTAAALAYEADHQGSKNILVYDLGGGTFDCSVVRLRGDVTEVLASHGNNHLGGDDFDARLVEHVLAHLSQTAGVDVSQDRAAMARVQRACETARIALSDAPFARIDEPYLTTHQGTPVNLSLELARSDFEALIAPHVDETLEAVHIALSGAGLAVADLDEVLLVGGATRTPLIQQRLEQALGMQPRAEINPELCVVTGAAIQAAVIAGVRVAAVLVDVTPYTFGTSAIDLRDGEPYPYCYFPLIRKNTPIPVTRSEAFATAYDGQTVIDVKVYQGEDPDALNNLEIGAFRIEGLSDLPAGNVIINTFSLDLNGILHVTAREKCTGLEKSVTIENATSRFAGEELAKARDRLAALFGETDAAAPPGDDEPDQRALVQAQALIEKGERLLESICADDREDLVDRMEALREALAGTDPAAIAQASAELADLLYYLES